MKKFLSLGLVCILLFFVIILPISALTTWRFEDWQDGNDYGLKTKISSNITNLKGKKNEDEGMEIGPYNKASKAELSDGITEEVYVGLDLNHYQNSELFELSIALNQQEYKYLTEAVIMTQKIENKFVLTSSWAKDKNPIATIEKDGVYTYKWEFRQDNNKIKVKFTVLDYGKELGTTDFVELKTDSADKATNVRYLWACNIKAKYGVDIYTTLPQISNNSIENPDTSDNNLLSLFGLMIAGILCLYYIIKRNINGKNYILPKR